MTEEEQKEYLKKLIEQQLTIQSDEAEGMQSIALNLINACSPDYNDMEQPAMTLEQIYHMLHLDDPDIFPDQREISQGTGAPGTDSPSKPIVDKSKEPKWPDDFKYPDGTDMDKVAQAIINDPSVGPINAIVEFAQPSIRDAKGVDYSLSVKPGDTVNVNTIIGSATINDERKFIRSIFSEGTVAGTDHNKDFKHLFGEAGANRHIIIENCQISGDVPEINTDVIQEIQEKFRDEAMIFQLVVDNICEAQLPTILLKRYDQYIINPLMRIPRPNGREIYSEYIDYVNDIRETYRHDIEKMSSEDSIRSSATTVDNLNELGKRIIARRRKFYEDIKRAAIEYVKSLDPCEYDPEYEDCKYLAWLNPISNGMTETTTSIGQNEYNNYYVTLLSKVDIRSENEYAKKYYDILTDIIGTRIATEQYSIDAIKAEFNENYRRNISAMQEPFERLEHAMNLIDGDVTMGDVTMWINEHTDDRHRDNYIDYTIRQMANIFMFVRNYNAKNFSKFSGQSSRKWYPIPERSDSMTQSTNADIFSLVKEEQRILSEFWKEMISKYDKIDINDCISEIKQIPTEFSKYAVWPQERVFTVKGVEYHHYLFENRPEGKDKEDKNIERDLNDTIPEEPTDVNPPEVGPEILPLNENDPHENEITIKDYEYWVRYFALATVISLPFLNCGLDFPPSVMFIPLPCIFICLGVVYIQILDIVLVFGLSIRGMYIWPVILYVNCSNSPCNIMTPLVSMLRTIKSKISAKINAMTDLPVTSIANMFINMLEEDNRNLKKQNKQMEIVLD